MRDHGDYSASREFKLEAVDDLGRGVRPAPGVRGRPPQRPDVPNRGRAPASTSTRATTTDVPGRRRTGGRRTFTMVRRPLPDSVTPTPSPPVSRRLTPRTQLAPRNRRYPAGAVKNTVKTFVLLAGLGGLLVIIGQVLGGYQGAPSSGLPSACCSSASPTGRATPSPSVLPAVPVTEQEMPEYYAIVRELTQRAGMPMPQLYITPTSSPTPSRPGATPSMRPWPSPRASCASSLGPAPWRPGPRDQPRRQPRHPHRLGGRRHRPGITFVANFLRFSAIFGGAATTRAATRSRCWPWRSWRRSPPSCCRWRSAAAASSRPTAAAPASSAMVSRWRRRSRSSRPAPGGSP